MTNIPAGWYPDPENASQSRWWDGNAWSDHRSAPVPTNPYSTQLADLKAPEGTPWNTVWIWIIVFLPYVSSLGIFAIDWSSLFDLSNPIRGELALLTSPGYLLTLAGGLISYGLIAWFAYLDWRTLADRGVPRPFHWAWAFLSIVYPIGRSVVVRRRTGHGISPMWVTIIAYAVFTIGSMVYMIAIMTSILGSIANLPYTYYAP
jgi:hypothetical protein